MFDFLRSQVASYRSLSPRRVFGGGRGGEHLSATEDHVLDHVFCVVRRHAPLVEALWPDVCSGWSGLRLNGVEVGEWSGTRFSVVCCAKLSRALLNDLKVPERGDEDLGILELELGLAEWVAEDSGSDGTTRPRID